MKTPTATRISLIAILSTALLAVSACSDDDTAGSGFPAEAGAAQTTYAEIVLASYDDSITEALALKSAIDAFVAAPTENTLTAARQAWLDSREPYLQTEVYRFYGGPIDNDDDGPEGQINAWPLDEAYIDYIDGGSTTGIIGDSEQEISAAALTELNEQGGEKNIATGYHAIEFLLWGQDLSEDGPGNRPVSDYTTDSADGNHERRADYLTTVAELLVADLQQVRDAWADGVADNYRSEWNSITPEAALSRAMTGMIILSGFETGGERLQTALDSGDQEDEHSCFSDNTHRDMIQDIRGIRNVWVGEYVGIDGSTVSGTGIRDVVAAAEPQLAASITEQVDESLRLAEALQTPFDREIALGNTEGRGRVVDLVQSLQAQEDLLEEAFLAFGFAVPSVE